MKMFCITSSKTRNFVIQNLNPKLINDDFSYCENFIFNFLKFKESGNYFEFLHLQILNQINHWKIVAKMNRKTGIYRLCPQPYIQTEDERLILTSAYIYLVLQSDTFSFSNERSKGWGWSVEDERRGGDGKSYAKELTDTTKSKRMDTKQTNFRTVESRRNEKGRRLIWLRKIVTSKASILVWASSAIREVSLKTRPRKSLHPKQLSFTNTAWK